jgi:hypothetical protein
VASANPLSAQATAPRTTTARTSATASATGTKEPAARAPAFACQDAQDCVNLASGDTICHGDVEINCGEPCSSNADCTGDQFPICIASTTNGAGTNPPNQTTMIAAICQGVPAACSALE